MRDEALTPYQRVLQSPLSAGLAVAIGWQSSKGSLTAKYVTLNPAALKRKIERLQQRLAKTSNKTNWRECARMVSVRSAQRINPF
jgi:hypothetical protein